MRGEFLDLGGHQLYYYAAGTRGAGEPVLFLHGFPASSHLWGSVVRAMPGGHRLIVLDQLGYGRSDRPEGAPVSADSRSASRVRSDLPVAATRSGVHPPARYRNSQGVTCGR